jgi:hypothetical protein
LDLSHRTDPLGVFSVYVNADPTRREATAIDIKNRYDAGAEVGPGGEPATPEPRLTERLGERALATGARVSPVEGAARGVLSEAAGIGALLRW